MEAYPRTLVEFEKQFATGEGVSVVPGTAAMAGRVREVSPPGEGRLVADLRPEAPLVGRGRSWTSHLGCGGSGGIARCRRSAVPCRGRSRARSTELHTELREFMLKAASEFQLRMGLTRNLCLLTISPRFATPLYREL